jgi:integrase
VASLRKRGRNWYIRYRSEGRSTEVKAGPDKQVAKSLAKDLENKLQRIKLGLLDSREAASMEAEKKPLADHVSNYLSYLADRGNAPAHIEGVRAKLAWFLDESRIVRLSQIRPSLAQSALGRLKALRKSDRTVSHYAAAWKAFTAWLKRDRRTQEDLLADLERPPVLQARCREDLPPELAARLIEATRSGPVRRGLSGEDRAWLYTLATVTGLRRGELQALRPECFGLDGPIPIVSLPGVATKNGKPAVQPLPADLVPALRRWLASFPAGTPIFPANHNTSVMIRADLKAAGIAPNGFDFHSLRHTYISRIVAAGANVKDAMELARHSDPHLTLGVYSHSRLESLAAVVNRLPTSCPRLEAPPVPSGLDVLCPTETTRDSEGHPVQYATPVSRHIA